jgi:methionyl-tRNA formyltransferase
MFVLGTNELLHALPSVFDGSVKHELRDQNENEATAAAKLSAEDARIDFSAMSATKIHNRCRGLAGWPGTWSTFTVSGNTESKEEPPQRIKLITTVVISSLPSTEAPTNTVVLTKLKMNSSSSEALDVLRVVCGDGSVLGIVELQPASKKVMSSKSFINGLRGASLSWTIPG